MTVRIPSFLPRAALAAALFVACTEEPAGPGDPGGSRVPVSIEIMGMTEGEVGASTSLSAIVRDSSGDTLRNVTIAWSTSDSARVPLAPLVSLLPEGSGAAVLAQPSRIAVARIIASVGALSDTVTFRSHLPPFTFVFADTAPEAERRLLYDGIQDAHAFQRAVFEKTLADPITISAVYAAPGCASGGAAAFASGRTITFCLGNQGWKAHGPVIRQKIVQHELFHLWQFAHWSADPAKSPAWLVEGAAELMGYYGVAQRGFLTMAVALGCQRKESADFAANQPPGLPPLQNVETRQAFQSTMGPLYTHSMLGAHYLAEEGDGLAALETYGNAVKTSATWQAAFEQAFKTTPAAFYGAFPGYVSGLPVPATYGCRI